MYDKESGVKSLNVQKLLYGLFSFLFIHLFIFIYFISCMAKRLYGLFSFLFFYLFIYLLYFVYGKESGVKSLNAQKLLHDLFIYLFLYLFLKA